MRVINAETLLLLVDIEKGNVFFARVGIVEDGMAVAECAAFAILSAEADGRALDEQAAEGESFAEAPVDRAAILVGLGARIEETFDLGVNFEVGRNLGETGDNLGDNFGGDAGGHRRIAVARLKNGG